MDAPNPRSTQRQAGDKAPPGDSPSWKIPPRRTWLLFAIALLVNFLAVRLFMPGAETPLTIPYTLFKVEVGKRNVQSIYSRGETLSGRFVSPVTFPPTSEVPQATDTPQPKAGHGMPRRGPPRTSVNFATTLPAFADPGLERF